MVVSDLDDTLVGDDDATHAFSQWWWSEGAAAGGALVYNTGRALDLFCELLAEKSHCLPVPDLLITAVGTVTYEPILPSIDGGGGIEWREVGTPALDEGWDIGAVREAAYAALNAVGADCMHFRPPSEMNRHKITCGVATSALPKALDCIAGDLDAAGVKYQTITSGKGEWRYVDLVPQGAGKFNAMEAARKRLKFAPHAVVAAGDSNNDRDVLEVERGEGHHGIVVGNAQPDLMTWAQTAAGKARGGAGKEGQLVITKAHRALGVLEGLEKLGFIV